MIGVIAAMDIEAEGLIEKLSSGTATEILGITFTQGILHGQPMVVAVSGIGKVNAGMCTALMIREFKPEMIFSIGVAGSISEKLNLLDICIASFVCQHDFDTSPFGDPLGLLPGHTQVCMPCDAHLVKVLEKSAAAYGNVFVDGMACGDQFIANIDKKLEIHRLFSACACEMESGAIGQVASQNRTPFAVVRVISDSLTDDAHMEYEVFKKKAAEKTVSVICDAVQAL